MAAWSHVPRIVHRKINILLHILQNLEQSRTLVAPFRSTTVTAILFTILCTNEKRCSVTFTYVLFLKYYKICIYCILQLYLFHIQNDMQTV